MKQADKSEITTPMGDGAPPEGGLVWGEVVLAVVFRLYPPIPVSLNNPQQLQTYPCLYMHLSPARRVWRTQLRSACHVLPHIGLPRSCRAVTRSNRLFNAYPLSFAYSLFFGPCCAILFFPGVAEHRKPQPCPFIPEVTRIVREVLASSAPRGVPENRSFLPDYYLTRLLLLLRIRVACVVPFISPSRERDILPLHADFPAPRLEGPLQPPDRTVPLFRAARGLLLLLHPSAARACCHITHSLQPCRHLLAHLCSCVFWQAAVLPVWQDAPYHWPDLLEVFDGERENARKYILYYII